MSYYDPDPRPEHFTPHTSAMWSANRGMDEPSNGSRRTGRRRTISYTCSGCDWIGTEYIGTGDDEECPECGEKVQIRLTKGAKWLMGIYLGIPFAFFLGLVLSS